MSISEPPQDPRTRANLTPALAVRVGMVGTIILVLFAIIFFRLWFLQVLTGTHYVEAAARNTTHRVPIAPPRGKILARNGNTVLVSSTTALAAVVVPDELPVKVNQTNILKSFPADDAVYDRLAQLLHKSTKPKPCVVATPPPGCNVASGKCPHSTTRDLSPIACEVAQQIALNFYADVTIAQPVSRNLLYYIDERENSFRGVEVQQVSVSGYPFGQIGAQTLGTVGRLSQAETKQASFKHVNKSAIVGQSGLEYEYDRYLRGTYGHQNVEVNAEGVAVGQGKVKQPVAGDDLRTTLDLPLEKVGQSALQHAIDTNEGLGGAFVAMNPDTGAIYGMGSLPSYNPDIFTKPVIPTKEYDRIFKHTNNPQFNRATQSAAPTGSTFKVITATAALESGAWSPDETFDDDRDVCFGTYCPQNSGGVHYGPVDLASAIKVSDDEFFYNLGGQLNVDKPQGGPLQKWANLFGIGRNPHVDLPAASDGLLPTPTWFDRIGREEAECEAATGDYRYYRVVGGEREFSATRKKGYKRWPKHPFDAATQTGGCGIGTPNATWTIGDNVQAAVGQGDDEVSPLQLAMVYAAIANGGTIVRPHVGDDIQSPNGTVLQKLNFPAQRHLDINPEYLDTIRTGLNEAAQGGGTDPSPGTSQTVMQNFGKPVYAKTGTAQYFANNNPNDEKDYAWYAAYVPGSATSKPIVVVVWVEGGGFGAIASAPVARQIMSQWFYGKPGPWMPGDSKDQ